MEPGTQANDETEETPGYRALRDGLAFMEQDRVVFHVQGPRAERVVNGIVTNSLDGLDQGQGVYAFALSAKGRPIAEMRVLPAPGFERRRAENDANTTEATDHVWVDVPPAAADALADLLRRSVPPIFATVEQLPMRRLSLLGPSAVAHAARMLAGIGVDGVPPSAPLNCATAEVAGDLTGLLVQREPLEGDGVDLYVRSELGSEIGQVLEKAVEGIGGSRCEAQDFEIVRVENGLPVFGREITAENLPQETGQTERAVSFKKGCYTGQEVVARIHYRGHVNRVLRGLRPGSGSDATVPGFAPGATLYLADRAVGEVRTVVHSPRLGVLGLAYIRTSAEPGARLGLETDGPPRINVTDLPFT